MSVAGIGGRSCLFDGFPSPKPGRRRSRVVELMEREESFVLYESPYRILALIDDIAAIDPSRQVCVGREMTKIHEEFITGSAESVTATLHSRESQKGEFAVLVAGKQVS